MLVSRVIGAAVLIGAGLAACSDGSATAEGLGTNTFFDVVIGNGRVIDPETRHDAISNVGIKDGLIAAISEAPLSGKREIDATGHIDKDGRVLDWHDEYEVGAYHPRTTGTHGKALRLARENDIPWMQMIENLSYNTAKHMGDAGLEDMQKRGRLQEGMVADITIFNPETVTENSDYAAGKNGLPTTGIPYVFVNGVVVVDDSTVLEGVTPGQPIRYPVESESRFVPLKNEGDWVLKVKFPH